jgi:hypothetical protein
MSRHRSRTAHSAAGNDAPCVQGDVTVPHALRGFVKERGGV